MSVCGQFTTCKNANEKKKECMDTVMVYCPDYDYTGKPVEPSTGLSDAERLFKGWFAINICEACKNINGDCRRKIEKCQYWFQPRNIINDIKREERERNIKHAFETAHATLDVIHEEAVRNAKIEVLDEVERKLPKWSECPEKNVGLWYEKTVKAILKTLKEGLK